MIRRPPRSTQSRSSAASDVYKRQVPDRSSRAPCSSSSSVRSTATIWNASVRRPTSVPGLPTLPSVRRPWPSSATRPSAISSATRSETVTRVSPVLRARSAREPGPSWNSCWSTIDRWWARACSGSTLLVGRSVRVGISTFVSTPSLQLRVKGYARDVRTILRGRVVAPTGVIQDGLVVVDDALITWVGAGDAVPADLLPGSPDDPPESPEDTRPDTGPPAQVRTLLPGLVDLHCHGGGGAGFPDALDAATARPAIAEHLRHGTTSLVASLVTADEATLLERTALLAGLADVGELAGIHLEGPYLSPARCGAQDPALMTEGRPGVVREIARVARGHLVTMTVAPEVSLSLIHI